ncbi:YbaN family protein [Bacillus haikouensis]|nr:YbaN family protein [Bacillus haikouensis]
MLREGTYNNEERRNLIGEGSRQVKSLQKGLFIALGFVFMTIAIIGIVLPLIPTTPLLLLASYFFVKGSQRFEIWFKDTGVYKKHLEGFVQNRSMTLRQKITLMAFSDVMIMIPLFMTDKILVKAILSLIIMYKHYYFIFRIKTVKIRSY